VTNIGRELSGTSLALFFLLALFIYGRRIFGDSDKKPSSLDIGYKPPSQPTATSSLEKSQKSEVSVPANPAKENLPIQVRREDLLGEIYLDIETLRLSNEVPGGWGSIDKFGVAVAITWDLDGQYRAWFETDVFDLIEELKKFERIVTYNGDRFDLVVLSGYGETRGLPARSFDVLASIENALGHRVKLDKVASDTLGLRKDGDGLDAVRWWRQGERDRVIEYCKKDVELLMRVVAHGRMHGHFKSSGRKVAVDWNPQSAALTSKAREANRKAKKAASSS
jgi:DEAD/DEAH box helicase domain-containing protein